MKTRKRNQQKFDSSKHKNTNTINLSIDPNSRLDYCFTAITQNTNHPIQSGRCHAFIKVLKPNSSSSQTSGNTSYESFASSSKIQDYDWYCFGGNDFGQLGLGDGIEERRTPTLFKPKDFELLEVFTHHGNHTFMLSKTGRLFSSGYNHYGQLGIGSNQNHKTKPVPVRFFDGKKISVVCCGHTHTFVVCVGDVFSFGRNRYGELALGSSKNEFSMPQVVTKLPKKKLLSIELGMKYSVCLFRDGSVYTCGQNPDGRLGHGDKIDRSTLEEIKMLRKLDVKIKQISVGACHLLCVSTDGNVYGNGYNPGTLGMGHEKDISIPTRIKFFEDKNVLEAHSSCYVSCFRTDRGVYFCGQNSCTALDFLNLKGNLKKVLTPIPFKDMDVECFRGGWWFNVFLARKGNQEPRVYTSGENGVGQLGIGKDQPDSSLIQEVGLMGNVVLPDIPEAIFSEDEISKSKSYASTPGTPVLISPKSVNFTMERFDINDESDEEIETIETPKTEHNTLNDGDTDDVSAEIDLDERLVTPTVEVSKKGGIYISNENKDKGEVAKMRRSVPKNIGRNQKYFVEDRKNRPKSLKNGKELFISVPNKFNSGGFDKKSEICNKIKDIGGRKVKMLFVRDVKYEKCVKQLTQRVRKRFKEQKVDVYLGSSSTNTEKAKNLLKSNMKFEYKPHIVLVCCKRNEKKKYPFKKWKACTLTNSVVFIQLGGSDDVIGIDDSCSFEGSDRECKIDFKLSIRNGEGGIVLTKSRRILDSISLFLMDFILETKIK